MLKPLVPHPEDRVFDVIHPGPTLHLLYGYLSSLLTLDVPPPPEIAQSIGLHLLDLVAAVIGPGAETREIIARRGLRAARLRQTSNSGTLAVSSSAGGLATAWTRTSETGGFSGSTWGKLYDVVGTRIVVVFEDVVASGALWPSTREPFELVVGDQRVEAVPRITQAPDANGAAHAILGVPIAINAPEVGPLRMAARYAGYRANWTVWQPGQKLGAFVQSMAPPRNLPAIAPRSEENEVGDRDVESFGRETPASALPSLTIRYRIEPAAR